jgi:hypothetical protein
MDHSMFTAIVAVWKIKNVEIEDSIWSINAEEKYHEEIIDKYLRYE